jgi:multidrug efflux pump subunit AcrB
VATGAGAPRLQRLARLAQAPLAFVWPEHRARTKEEIRQELAAASAMPGVLPTWLQPIQTRLVMLSSGFRAMMGVKIFGDDLAEIERIGLEMERVLREVPGAVDVVADRIIGKPYLEYVIDREAAARYGASISDVQEIIEVAIGGMRTTTTVEGAERYPVRVRYARELRDSLEALDRILLPTSAGAQVPLTAVAEDPLRGRAAGDQEREHAEGRLRHAEHARPRRGLGGRGRRPRAGRRHRRRAGRAAARLLLPLGRAVRGAGAGHAAACRC